MSRAGSYNTRERTASGADVEKWLGNGLASIGATVAVVSGVIGLLVAFGYIHGDALNPFQDGIVWLTGGLVVAIAANVFRREHHIQATDVSSTSSSGSRDLGMALGNSLATILAALAVAAGVIGLLVAFGYINGDATNSFQDGIVWMFGGLILGVAGNVFRREHHIETATYDDRAAVSERTMRYDSERAAPRYETETPAVRQQEREYTESIERNRRS